MVELFSWRAFSMDLTQANHTTHEPPANVVFLRNPTTLNWNKNIQPCVIRLMKALILLEFFLEVMVLFGIDAISVNWVSAMCWNYYASSPPSHNFSTKKVVEKVAATTVKILWELEKKRSWVPLYLLLTIKLWPSVSYLTPLRIKVLNLKMRRVDC